MQIEELPKRGLPISCRANYPQAHTFDLPLNGLRARVVRRGVNGAGAEMKTHIGQRRRLRAIVRDMQDGDITAEAKSLQDFDELTARVVVE